MGGARCSSAWDSPRCCGSSPGPRQLRRSAARQRTERARGPSFALVLRQRALWGTILGNFCSNYAFYFVFAALPLYLVEERGLSILSMTRFQTLLYLVDAASCAATGWILDGWVRRGASMNLAYKSALVLSAAGVGACLIAASHAGATAGAWLLLGTGLADGLTNPAVCSLTQRFAGPLASGRWMGVQNALSNTAGIVSPIITGKLVVAAGEHYSLALVGDRWRRARRSDRLAGDRAHAEAGRLGCAGGGSPAAGAPV